MKVRQTNKQRNNPETTASNRETSKRTTKATQTQKQMQEGVTKPKEHVLLQTRRLGLTTTMLRLHRNGSWRFRAKGPCGLFQGDCTDDTLFFPLFGLVAPHNAYWWTESHTLLDPFSSSDFYFGQDCFLGPLEIGENCVWVTNVSVKQSTLLDSLTVWILFAQRRMWVLSVERNVEA